MELSFTMNPLTWAYRGALIFIIIYSFVYSFCLKKKTQFCMWLPRRRIPDSFSSLMNIKVEFGWGDGSDVQSDKRNHINTLTVRVRLLWLLFVCSILKCIFSFLCKILMLFSFRFVFCNLPQLICHYIFKVCFILCIFKNVKSFILRWKFRFCLSFERINLGFFYFCVYFP